MTDLDRAIDVIIEALRSGGTLFAAGNGGSDAHAGHLVAELVGRFAYDRPPLAAIHISASGPVGSALANDYGWAEVFARQVEALATEADVLVVLTTSGRSANIMRAVEGAWRVVALTGPNGLDGWLGGIDAVVVASTATTTPAIQEQHQAQIHEIARRVELAMFPKEQR